MRIATPAPIPTGPRFLLTPEMKAYRQRAYIAQQITCNPILNYNQDNYNFPLLLFMIAFWVRQTIVQKYIEINR